MILSVEGLQLHSPQPSHESELTRVKSFFAVSWTVVETPHDLIVGLLLPNAGPYVVWGSSPDGIGVYRGSHPPLITLAGRPYRALGIGTLRSRTNNVTSSTRNVSNAVSLIVVGDLIFVSKAERVTGRSSCTECGFRYKRWSDCNDC